MFGHVFKYGLKSLLRTKEVLFWSLVFPFALCTLMYLAFGEIFETTEKFQAVPVAIVEEQQNMILTGMLTALSEERDHHLLITKNV